MECPYASLECMSENDSTDWNEEVVLTDEDKQCIEETYENGIREYGSEYEGEVLMLSIGYVDLDLLGGVWYSGKLIYEAI